MKENRAKRDAALALAQERGATLKEMADGIGGSPEGVRRSIARHAAV